MTTLLVVHHTPSPALQELLEAALAGLREEPLVELDVVVRPALSAGAVDLLAADGVLLGTPANMGYMSGALKHFFDLVYYPALQAKRGLPYGLWVHGGDDTTGAVASVERLATGMSWQRVAPAATVTGAPGAAQRAAVADLAATVGAHALGLL